MAELFIDSDSLEDELTTTTSKKHVRSCRHEIFGAQDLIIKILQYLNEIDLFCIRRVSKTWDSGFRTPQAWSKPPSLLISNVHDAKCLSTYRIHSELMLQIRKDYSAKGRRRISWMDVNPMDQPLFQNICRDAVIYGNIDEFDISFLTSTRILFSKIENVNLFSLRGQYKHWSKVLGVFSSMVKRLYIGVKNSRDQIILDKTYPNLKVIQKKGGIIRITAEQPLLKTLISNSSVHVDQNFVPELETMEFPVHPAGSSVPRYLPSLRCLLIKGFYPADLFDSMKTPNVELLIIQPDANLSYTFPPNFPKLKYVLVPSGFGSSRIELNVGHQRYRTIFVESKLLTTLKHRTFEFGVSATLSHIEALSKVSSLMNTACSDFTDHDDVLSELRVVTILKNLDSLATDMNSYIKYETVFEEVKRFVLCEGKDIERRIFDLINKVCVESEGSKGERILRLRDEYRENKV